MSAVLPWALRGISFASTYHVPVGLELYSVRDELEKNPQGTVRAVAKMGYQCVEFYGPYYEWTEAAAKDMRKLMDDLKIQCYSTHNDESNFTDAKIDHARTLNQILGTKYMVQAWSDPLPGRQVRHFAAGVQEESGRGQKREFQIPNHAASLICGKSL